MGQITDRMLYFVLADYGDAGHAFVETDIARNSLRQVIVDILSQPIDREIGSKDAVTGTYAISGPIILYTVCDVSFRSFS